jgi:hypothetical protein
MVGSANAGNAGSINISVGLAGTTSGGLQLWAATNQTHYIQFGDATSGASPYTGYVGYAHNNDSLIFGTATSTKMTLSDSGNLGLGVTPSAWGSVLRAFDIGTSGSLVSSASGAGGLSVARNAFYNGSAWIYKNTSTAQFYEQDAGAHIWYQAPSGTAGNAITFTQAMTLNASGNLSIGNTNDTYKLDVTTSSNDGIAVMPSESSQYINSTVFTDLTVNGTFIGIKRPSNGSPILNGIGTYDSSGGNNLAITSRSDIVFATDDTERMRITSGGNVGIGTTNPTNSKVQILGLNNTVTGYDDGLKVTSNNETVFVNYNWTGINANDTLRFATTGTERMRIKANGDVNIRTALRISDESTWGVSIYKFSTTGSPIIEADGGQALSFGTGGQESMRILNGGDLLINKTSLSGGSVGVEFERNSTTRMTTDGNSVLFLNRLTSDGTIVDIRRSGTQVGTISVTSSATAYNTSSDYRLKQDLKDFNGLDLLTKIKTYDYEWKSDKTRSYGVIAHELQSVINYAVTGVKDGNEMQGVDYSKIVPVLIKSIQELKQELDTLKNK